MPEPTSLTAELQLVVLINTQKEAGFRLGADRIGIFVTRLDVDLWSGWRDWTGVSRSGEEYAPTSEIVRLDVVSEIIMKQSEIR